MIKLNLFVIGGFILTISCLIVMMVNIVFGRKKINFIWSLFNLSVAIWGFGAFMVGISQNPQNVLLWWKINHIGVIWIPVFILHTVYLLTNRVNKKILVFAYIQAICFQLIELLPSHLFFDNVRLVFSSFYYVTLGVLYHPFFLTWIFLVVYAHVCVYKEYTVSTGLKRAPLLYFLVGSILGFSGGFTNFLIGYKIDILPYGNFTIPIYCIMATYAILKYRLMDIRIVFSRTAIIIIVYGTIFFISIILATVFKIGLIFLIGNKWWLIPVIVYTVAMSLAPFLYQKLQMKAEGEILRDERRNHAMIMTATRSIALVRNFDRLLNLIVRVLTKTLGIRYANVWLLNRDAKQYQFCVTRGGDKTNISIDLGNSLIKYLQGARKAIMYEEIKREYDERRDIFIKEIRDTMNRIGAELLVPNFIENELIGFLVLGPKKSGQMYTNEDINVLSNMANQSALAIENAQFLKERENMQGKLREAETLSTIRDLLGSFNHEMYNKIAPVSITLQKIVGGEYDKVPERLKSDAQKSVDITFFIKTYLGWVREYIESGDKIAAYQLSELVNGGISYSKDKIEKQNIKTQINVNPKIFIVGLESLSLLFRHLIIHSVYGYGMEDGGTINISARMLEDSATVEIIQLDTGDDLTKYIEEGSTMGGKKFAEKGKIGGVSYFIAQAIVSKHKGIFKVEPTGGKGTKFNIRLPLDFNKVLL